MSKWFATKVQTNWLISSVLMTGLQIYVLWELNGALTQILLASCINPLVIATVFAPGLALVWCMKQFAKHTVEKGE